MLSSNKPFICHINLDSSAKHIICYTNSKAWNAVLILICPRAWNRSAADNNHSIQASLFSTRYIPCNFRSLITFIWLRLSCKPVLKNPARSLQFSLICDPQNPRVFFDLPHNSPSAVPFGTTLTSRSEFDRRCGSIKLAPKWGHCMICDYFPPIKYPMSFTVRQLHLAVILWRWRVELRITSIKRSVGLDLVCVADNEFGQPTIIRELAATAAAAAVILRWSTRSGLVRWRTAKSHLFWGESHRPRRKGVS